MLSTRSPVFLDQAVASIADSLPRDPKAALLARNYGLTTMRSEVKERSRRWQDLHWALRFTRDPQSPVIACDQSVGMDGNVDDIKLALQDQRTTLFFPVCGVCTKAVTEGDAEYDHFPVAFRDGGRTDVANGRLVHKPCHERGRPRGATQQ